MEGPAVRNHLWKRTPHARGRVWAPHGATSPGQASGDAGTPPFPRSGVRLRGDAGTPSF